MTHNLRSLMRITLRYYILFHLKLQLLCIEIGWNPKQLEPAEISNNQDNIYVDIRIYPNYGIYGNGQMKMNRYSFLFLSALIATHW